MTTQREIMEGLLAGKSYCRPHWRHNGRIFLNEAGELRFKSDLFSALVPEDNLAPDLVECIPPNPHPVGTLAWAIEENKTHAVTCDESKNCGFSKNVLSNPNVFLYMSEVYSTTWRRCP